MKKSCFCKSCLFFFPVLAAWLLLGWGTHSYAQDSNSNSNRYWGFGYGSSSLDWENEIDFTSQSGLGLTYGFRPANSNWGFEINYFLGDEEELTDGDAVQTLETAIFRIEGQYLFKGAGTATPLLIFGRSGVGAEITESDGSASISETSANGGTHFGVGVEWNLANNKALRLAHRLLSTKIGGGATFIAEDVDFATTDINYFFLF